MDARVALITGGSSGIGQGIAIVMAEHGYDVAITYGNNPSGAEETRRAVEALGRRCLCYEAHFEDPEAPARIVDAAHADLGRLDVMVCNAAIDRRHSILTVTPAELAQIMQVDFAGYLLCAGAAARHMVRDQIAGSLFFITSTHGDRAYPDDASYGGLKAGINRACQSIALDLAPYGIRAICVAPGYTKVRPDRPTPPKYPIEKTLPLGRQGTPRDNGELVAFLASDKAGYITGVTIRVDGGLILPGPAEGWAEAPWIAPAWKQKQYEQIVPQKREDTSNG